MILGFNKMVFLSRVFTIFGVRPCFLEPVPSTPSALWCGEGVSPISPQQGVQKAAHCLQVCGINALLGYGFEKSLVEDRPVCPQKALLASTLLLTNSSHAAGVSWLQAVAVGGGGRVERLAAISAGCAGEEGCASVGWCDRAGGWRSGLVDLS